MKKGKFITLEGGEGTGKSTQVPYLKKFLEARGYHVVTTREPGGSPGAELIRSALIQGAFCKWEPLSEYLLLSAARRDHIEKTIKPALDSGKWVICDRFFDSSVAYQGAGGQISESILHQIYQVIAPDFEPDLTFIFDIPVEVGIQRTKERASLEDWFEKMPLEFHQAVREKFGEIARNNPDRCHLIDAQAPIEEISSMLQDVIIKGLI